MTTNDNPTKDKDGQRPVIDWKEALANVGNNRELFEDVKAAAMKEIPGILPSLTKAIQDGNVRESQRLAHTIKGAARAIAAHRTHDAAERIESAAAGQDLATALSSIDKLRATVDELIDTLTRQSTPN
jgi:HPt (histidine-containing phosphotransfer) domain-containing protein